MKYLTKQAKSNQATIKKKSSLTINLLALLFVLGGFFASTQTATAVPLTLFNSGVDASGAVLTTGSSDPHFTVVSQPGTTTAVAATVMTKHSAWVAAPAGSQWIGVGSSGQASVEPIGDYTYDLTFEIGAGLNPTTAVITGDWASDNGSKIFLNGVDTGFTNPIVQFISLTSFTLNSNFVSGTNTLRFVVNNSAVGPTGLLVANLSGTAVVPEPSTVALLGLGFLGMGCRRKKTS